MKTTLTAVVAAVILATEPLPIQRPAEPGGSCPHGYFTSGGFCAPSQGAQEAIPKPPNGVCPFGWTSSGSFCLRSGATR